jgi:hypothetical protein
MRSLSSFLVLVAACGGGSVLDPGAGDDPGGGTNTLFVNGDVSAHPRITNARSDVDFDTSISVRVMLNQQAVTGGTVTVTSSSGEFPLAYRPQENRWEGTIAGYDEVYILDVESGADKVTGVRVDGPDLHYFEKPIAGATVDSRMPLDVAWNADQTADSASIDAEEIDTIGIPDTGKYVLAAGALKSDKDTARTNRVRLTRANRVTPKGAVGGSEVSVEVENSIEVVAMPNPGA